MESKRCIEFSDADRARKHGMEDFISADPCTFDHASLFKILQNLTLEYRLSDPYSSLVREIGSKKPKSRAITLKNFHRVGSVPGKFSSWMNIAPDMGLGDVTDICVTCRIFSIGLRRIS